MWVFYAHGTVMPCSLRHVICYRAAGRHTPRCAQRHSALSAPQQRGASSHLKALQHHSPPSTPHITCGKGLPKVLLRRPPSLSIIERHALVRVNDVPSLVLQRLRTQVVLLGRVWAKSWPKSTQRQIAIHTYNTSTHTFTHHRCVHHTELPLRIITSQYTERNCYPPTQHNYDSQRTSQPQHHTYGKH